MHKMLPLYLIIMIILMYMSMKQNFFNQRIRQMEKHLSEEMIRIASKMKPSDQKDIDLQNLVFSKLVKYLFTNCVRFWKNI